MDPTYTDVDLYDQTIERNRCHILRYINANVFFDKMREKTVLSLNDVEEIQNKGFTRRDRAGLFLDKLQTKGNEGCIAFLEILEYEYPPVYKLITEKEAREPPPEYCKHRESYFASWLYKLPQLAEDLRKDYDLNKNLNVKFHDMENILKFAQENNRELERENEVLRKTVSNLTEEKIRVEKQLGDCMRETDKHRDMSLEYLQNCVQLQQERDHYKDRWREAMLDRDHFVATNNVDDTTLKYVEEMPSSTDTTYPRQTENLRSQVEILEYELNQMQEKCEELETDLKNALDELDCYRKKFAKKQESYEKLLKEKKQQDIGLEERRKRIEEYFSKIESLEQDKRKLDEEKNMEQTKRHEEAENRVRLFKEKHELENLYEQLKLKHGKLKAKCNRDSSESNTDENTTDDYICNMKRSASEEEPFDFADIPSDHTRKVATLPTSFYSTDISNRQSCLCNLRERQNQQKPVQVTLSDIKKNEIQFRHIQRTDTIECIASPSIKERKAEQLEDEKWKADSSVYYFKAKHACGSKSPKEEEHKKDFSFPEVMPTPLTSPTSPTSPSGDTKLNKRSIMDICTFDVCQSTLSSKWRSPSLALSKFTTVRLEYPVLGTKLNIYGGNFTGIYIRDISSNVSDQLSVGDQIVSVIITNKENRSTIKKTELKGCTLETACTAFTFKQESDPTLQIEGQTQVEITVRKTSEQDFRALTDWIQKHNNSGDLFYLRCNLHWHDGIPGALKLDKGDIVQVIGTHVEQEEYWKAKLYDKSIGTWTKTGIIPKETKKFKFYARHGHSENRAAFRRKNPPYVHVLPTKAKNRLPVHLVGEENIVKAIQKMMMADSKDFCTGIIDEGTGTLTTLSRQTRERHILLKNRNFAARYCCIVIQINTENATPEILRTIFGDIKLERQNTERIPDDIKHETICIPDQNITDKESLLTTIYSIVKNGQERVYWMTEENLDKAIVQEYKHLLITNESLAKKQIDLDRSVSNST